MQRSNQLGEVLEVPEAIRYFTAQTILAPLGYEPAWGSNEVTFKPGTSYVPPPAREGAIGQLQDLLEKHSTAVYLTAGALVLAAVLKGTRR